MKMIDRLDDEELLASDAIVRREASKSGELPFAIASGTGLVVGELVAMLENGMTPLVTYAGQGGSAAVPARTVVDLNGSHVGKQVALAFENGDPARPIVMGVIRSGGNWPLDSRPPNVVLDADDSRLVVSAKQQLVLQCGKASLTLTKEGKVLVQGTYISIHSSGVNRLKGGSVQIN
jgi:hypothetical protein